jgi:ParB family chromosome partitioning protein
VATGAGSRTARNWRKSLALDMGAWFTPTAENYFGCISRSQILVAIDEAKGAHAPALDKLKKGELAARAQDLVAGSGWLPRNC